MSCKHAGRNGETLMCGEVLPKKENGQQDKCLGILHEWKWDTLSTSKSGVDICKNPVHVYVFPFFIPINNQ